MGENWNAKPTLPQRREAQAVSGCCCWEFRGVGCAQGVDHDGF